MNTEMTRSPRTIIRLGHETLRFALPTASDGETTVTIEPWTVKSGMSMAANLREAFLGSDLLAAAGPRGCALVDVPVSVIPIDEYDETTEAELHALAFPALKHEAVMHYVLPDLNCVAVFSVNKDVRTVVTDHFTDTRFLPAIAPVWQHLHRRSHAGTAQKLYAYLREGHLSLAAFRKNRFRFCNTFAATEVTDTAYYIMYVFQQLAMDQRRDELFIVADATPTEALRDELRRYVQNVFTINPTAEFNRAPVTRLPHATYDIICLCE